jgi:hypothetical protein
LKIFIQVKDPPPGHSDTSAGRMFFEFFLIRIGPGPQVHIAAATMKNEQKVNNPDIKSAIIRLKEFLIET